MLLAKPGQTEDNDRQTPSAPQVKTTVPTLTGITAVNNLIRIKNSGRKMVSTCPVFTWLVMNNSISTRRSKFLAPTVQHITDKWDTASTEEIKGKCLKITDYIVVWRPIGFSLGNFSAGMNTGPHALFDSCPITEQHTQSLYSFVIRGGRGGIEHWTQSLLQARPALSLWTAAHEGFWGEVNGWCWAANPALTSLQCP